MNASAMLIRQAAARQNIRSFSVSAYARGDAIKDLYLKELKSYKPTAVKSSDIAQAKDFVAPAKPASPKFTGDIAAELAEYAKPAAQIAKQ
ncbi:hypothetical protein GQ42DRAFT_52153 [Ramicandelaber brevisporus]|nr:hypothetical protein GQ42DRAFT_52153 [Ramicandelaber brevisporus]